MVKSQSAATRSIEEIKNAAERLVSEFNGHNRGDAALSLDERFANSLVTGSTSPA